MNSPDGHPLTEQDQQLLTTLETALWQEETRFDRMFMDRVLAADFHEFGRSGRAHSREAILNMEREPILSHLPLRDLRFISLAADVVQLTYISEVEYGGVVERARRSSIWSRSGESWELRFHQGTPLFEP